MTNRHGGHEEMGQEMGNGYEDVEREEGGDGYVRIENGMR